jgi:methyl-accepting chemotaxis protein
MKLFSLSIFQKILIAMLFVAVVPLSVIWYINYQNTIEQTTDGVNQQLANVSDKLASHVNSWVTMNLKVLNQNAALKDMVSMDGARQNPILRSVLNEYKWSYLVFTVGPDGMNVGRSDDLKLIDYSDRVYFKDVMKGAPMGKQVIVSRTTGKPAVILSAPIFNVDSTTGEKKIAGVIAIGMAIAEMSERITNLRIGRTGYAFLLDEGGKVVAHQKEEYADKSADFSKHPAFVQRPQTGKKLISYQDGDKDVIAYVQKTDQGWTMVAQQDYDEAFRPVHDANWNALLLLIATLVAVTMIAYLFSQQLANPIRRLTRIADEMSRGRAFAKVTEASRGDEIGALAAAIDRMGTSIRLAIERLRAINKQPANEPRLRAER